MMLSTSSDSLSPPFMTSGDGHFMLSPETTLSSVPCLFDSTSSGSFTPERPEPEWIHGTAEKVTENGQTYYVHRIVSEEGRRNIEKYLHWREACSDILQGDAAVSVSEFEGKPEIVIKRSYFPGLSVQDMLSKMSIKDKLLCLYDVSVQLNDLHERVGPEGGFVHGDVLLSNIFRNEEQKKYFITDEFLYLFEPQYCVDIACAWDNCLLRKNNTRRDALNLQYLSPSVLDKGFRSAKSDVYSFGVLIYHMFNKALPFPFKLSKEDVIARMKDANGIKERLRIPGAKASLRELESKMRTLVKFCLGEESMKDNPMRQVRNFLHQLVYKFLIPEDEPRIFWQEKFPSRSNYINLSVSFDILIRTIRLSWEPYNVNESELGYDERQRKLEILLQYAGSYDGNTDIVTMEKFNRLFCWFGKFFINRDDIPEEGETNIREELRKHVDANIDRCFDLIYVRSDVLTDPQVKDYFLGHTNTSNVDSILMASPSGSYAIYFNPSEYSSMKNFPFVIKYTVPSGRSDHTNMLATSLAGGFGLDSPVDSDD